MQLESFPRFRTDLVAECIETDGQRFIDVIDPDTGDAFRFYEVEYSLACAMDGERDVAGLVQWAKEELGIEPSAAELQNVITTLGGLGYLEAAQAAADVAARGTGDDDYGLQRGVIAARPEAMPSAGDVELGRVAHHASSAGMDDAPSGGDLELGGAGGHAAAMTGGGASDDLELGAPGAAEPMPTLRRGKTRPDQDDDGPTNLPPADVGSFDDDEVSVDLSQHLDLGRDDVKEAVRMSRSMQAVQVPQDLLDQLGDQEAAIAARAQAAKDEALEARRRLDEPVSRPPEPPAPVVDVRPEPVKPVVKPEPRPKTPTAPPVDQHAKPIAVKEPGGGGVSTFLVVLLVLALLGGGAFFVYKYVLSDKKSDDTAEATPGTGSGKVKKNGSGTAVASGTDVGTAKASGTDVGTGTGTASGTAIVDNGPPPPSAKLEAVPGAPIDVDGGDGGVVAWVVDDGAVVAVGDPLIQYKGVEYYKGKLGNSRAGLIREIEVSVPGEIDKATKQRDKAAASGNTAEVKRLEKYIAERTKRLGQKQDDAKKLQDKIDGFTIKATAAGAAHPKFAVGKRVGKTAVVAQIDGEAALAAKFSMPAGERLVDDSIRIAPKGAPDKSVTCLITAVTADTVTATCGAETGLTAGSDVEIAP